MVKLFVIRLTDLLRDQFVIVLFTQHPGPLNPGRGLVSQEQGCISVWKVQPCRWKLSQDNGE